MQEIVTIKANIDTLDGLHRTGKKAGKGSVMLAENKEQSDADTGHKSEDTGLGESPTSRLCATLWPQRHCLPLEDSP